MTSNFNSRPFQTAARRRGGRPLVLTIQHTREVEEGDTATGDRYVTYEDVDVDLRIDPRLDVVRLGVVFGGLANAIKGTDGQTAEQKLATLDSVIGQVRKSFRDCIVPPDRAKYDEVAESIDAQTFGQIVQYVTQELTGVDPTRRTSSSDGSPPTGTDSTPGPSPAV